MTIEITKQDALMIHFALIKYSKQLIEMINSPHNKGSSEVELKNDR